SSAPSSHSRARGRCVRAPRGPRPAARRRGRAHQRVGAARRSVAEGRQRAWSFASRTLASLRHPPRAARESQSGRGSGRRSLTVEAARPARPDPRSPGHAPAPPGPPRRQRMLAPAPAPRPRPPSPAARRPAQVSWVLNGSKSMWRNTKRLARSNDNNTKVLVIMNGTSPPLLGPLFLQARRDDAVEIRVGRLLGVSRRAARADGGNSHLALEGGGGSRHRPQLSKQSADEVHMRRN
ncbi:Protein of unknown function, partial [Gryllus bimaculatus]